jgi:uncharacterized membrane protein YphA (DoxX/SURF4 family)
MTTTSTKSIGFTIARVLTGLVWVVFGLNGFLQFLPLPPMGPRAGAFMGALAATGYMFPLIKGVEVIGGALLLGNRFVPLALTLLAPGLVNILAFHLFLEPSGLPLPIVLLALEIYLARKYRHAFRPLLQAQQAPESAAQGSSKAPALA